MEGWAVRSGSWVAEELGTSEPEAMAPRHSAPQPLSPTQPPGHNNLRDPPGFDSMLPPAECEHGWGAEQDGVSDIVVQHVKRLTSTTPGKINRRWRNYSSQVYRNGAENESVFQSPRPVQLLLRIRRVKLLLLVVLGWWAYRLVIMIAILQSGHFLEEGERHLYFRFALDDEFVADSKSSSELTSGRRLSDPWNVSAGQFGMHDIHPMVKGCVYRPPNVKEFNDGIKVIKAYQVGLTMTGWQIETAVPAEEKGPPPLTVYASNDLEHWEFLISNRFRYTRNLQVRYFEDEPDEKNEDDRNLEFGQETVSNEDWDSQGEYSTDEETEMQAADEPDDIAEDRHFKSDVNIAPPTAIILNVFVTLLVRFVLWTVGVIALSADRNNLATELMSFSFGCCSCIELISGLLLLAEGLPRESFPAFAYFLWDFLMLQAWSFGAAARRFAESMFGLGLLLLLIGFFHTTLIYSDLEGLLQELPPEGVLLVVAGLVLLYHKRVFILEARKRVKEDTVQYETVWRAENRDESALAVLDRISDIVNEVRESPGVKGSEPRQVIRDHLEPDSQSNMQGVRTRRRASLQLTRLRRISPIGVQPLTDLELLYHQALCVRPILNRKSSQWATASDGHVECKAVGRDDSGTAIDRSSSNGTIETGHIKVAGVDIERVPSGGTEDVLSLGLEELGRVGSGDQRQHTSLKPVGRAMSKAKMVYDGDVSRLLDICRARIGFSAISDIQRCLAAIVSDEEVQVRAIKHNLKDEPDKHGGFRFVSLNLVLKTKQAVELGLDLHICELQLALISQLQLLTSLRHTRYLLQRNARSLQLSHSKVGMQMRAFWGFRPNSQARRNVSPSLKEMEAGHGYLRSLDLSSPKPRSFSQTKEPAVGSHDEVQPYHLCSDSGLRSEEPAKGQSLLQEAILKLFRNSMQQAPDSLDLQVSRGLSKAMSDSNSVSAFYTSQPLASALSFRAVQALLLFVAVLLLSISALGAFELSKQDIRELRFLNVTILSTDSTAPVSAESSAKLKQVSLFLDDCPRGITQSFDYFIESNSYNTKTLVPHKMNGWGATLLPDAKRITAWSSEDGHVWRCMLPHYGKGNNACEAEVNFSDETDGNESDDENEVELNTRSIKVDITAPWHYYVLTAGIQTLRGLGYLAAMISAVWGREDIGPWCLSVSHGVTSLSLIIGLSACLAHTNSMLEKGGFSLLLIFSASFAVSLQLMPVSFVPTQAFLSATFVAIIEASWHQIYHHDWIVHLLAAGDLFLLFGCLVVALRRLSVVSDSLRLISKDKDLYDKIWQETFDQPGHETALNDLAVCVKTLETGSNLPLQMLPQLYARESTSAKFGESLKRLSSNSAFERLVSMDSVSEVSHPSQTTGSMSISAIKSLDQIFRQAEIVHGVLRHKVQEWADVSDGYFSHVSGASFVRWADAKKHTNILSDIKWASLKGIHRTIEKQLRSYCGDPSRLCDVARQSIIFQEVQALTRCVLAIQADPEVAILRVKNRYDTSYDSRRSAG